MRKLIYILMLIAAAQAHAADFVFYSPNHTNTASSVLEDGRQCAVTIPENLAADEMYLMWATNVSGFSEPVRINGTEAWWVGPDSVSTGETFSIYGRNLSLGGGDTFAWCVEEDAWITNSAGNPYKADFVVPTSWTSGMKTLRAHNGSGREYGFADSVTLTVRDAWDWSAGITTNVTDFGAVADDGSDDTPSIEAALSAANGTDWSTVVFPAGTFDAAGTIGSMTLTKVRIMGAGKTNTVLRERSGIGNAVLLDLNMQEGEISDMTFETGATITTDNSLLDFQDSDDLYIHDIVASQYPNVGNSNSTGSEGSDHLTGNMARFNRAANIRIHDSTFDVAWMLQMYGVDQLSFSNCTFKGMNGANKIIGLSGNNGVSITDCVAMQYDDTSSQSQNVGSLWCEGRFVTGKDNDGGIYNLYIGGCSTTNFAPASGHDEQNAGEQIMWEAMEPLYYGDVTASTTNTATLDGLTSNHEGELAAIVKGTGVGQSRTISGYSAGEITVSPNWTVPPDTNSAVLIGGYVARVVVYDCRFEGMDRFTTYGLNPHTSGVQPTWGAFDLVVDNNHFQNMGTALFLKSKGEDGLASGTNNINPIFFPLIADNTVSNVRVGVGLYSMFDSGYDSNPYHEYEGILGATIRNTDIDTVGSLNAVYEIENTPSYPFSNLLIFEDNTATNFTTALTIDSYVTNDYWAGNTTNGVSWEP